MTARFMELDVEETFLNMNAIAALPKADIHMHAETGRGSSGCCLCVKVGTRMTGAPMSESFGGRPQGSRGLRR